MNPRDPKEREVSTWGSTVHFCTVAWMRTYDVQKAGRESCASSNGFTESHEHTHHAHVYYAPMHLCTLFLGIDVLGEKKHSKEAYAS